MNPPDMLLLLQRWCQAGWLREVDQVFAGFLAREAPGADGLLVLAAALASHQLGRGHVCLDLEATLADATATLAIPPELREPAQEEPPPTPAAVLQGVSLAQWQRALQHAALVGEAAGTTPLVLAGTRLYLRRFWEHERVIRSAIRARVEQRVDFDAATAQDVRRMLDALFPREANTPTPDWQKLSCALALHSLFTVVTGGPGTGKTTTVVKLLALLQHLALGTPGGRRLRIRLAAPTGKAAARLNTSIANAVQGLKLQHLPDAQALRDAIPTEVSTVHRLMASMGTTRRFRHDAQNKLPLDVLVLDEASMIDLETMSAVLQALPANARLVLLGDKDQLASVEAGSVLGELCRRADGGHYLPATRGWLHALSGEAISEEHVDAAGQWLDQAVAKLRHSYRFDAASGIGQLAAAVNAGDVARVRAIRKAPHADLAWLADDAQGRALRRLVLQGDRDLFGAADGKPVGYAHYLAVLREQHPALAAPRESFDAWARAVLSAYGQFQLLCAVRKGEQGVERMNEKVQALLHKEGLVAATQPWYVGRPVMVTRNDYGLGLMNGDVGVTLELPVSREDGAALEWMPRVAFPSADGGIRWVLPSRLQDVETVFAMTVHKSQGSEFTHAALLLPDGGSRVLTRELVYTGITRAKKWFTVAGAQQVLEQAVERPTRRAGGLLID
ncbi:MAG TPA: exodeoxyribonuclease V subunit alpha [Ramlibacter sp.]|jgi:exodeoxyribonuclease V alpha subunit|nr:exodeoxyribonuclease V subunit alpha [Ramlibacter sp.]